MEGKLIKINNIYTLMVNDKMIASDDEDFQIDYQINKLSLKNCQAVELGYDLDGLALSYVSDHLTKGSDEYHNSQVDFKEGFQKALEILGDKKFSVEDIQNVIDSNDDSLVYQIVSENGGISFFLDEDVLIQILQQTEWDVEVCCQNDCYGDYTTCKKSSFECQICTNTGIPKLDSNGCLILKRK